LIIEERETMNVSGEVMVEVEKQLKETTNM